MHYENLSALVKGLTMLTNILIRKTASPHTLFRSFHVTNKCSEIQKLTRLRVVDNNEIGKQAMAEGKPPRCIHVYNKTGIGKIGSDKYY